MSPSRIAHYGAPMDLPLAPPIEPQLAKSVPVSAKKLAASGDMLPEGDEWVYERKLDGFRAIVFVDGDEVYIQSRGKKPLHRYFPELTFPAGRYVADGEIIIENRDRENFEALQMRLHPAESRIARLSAEIPAIFVAFDLLAQDDAEYLDAPWHERRTRLEAIDGLRRAEVVTDPATAREWLQTAEGVIAKDRDAPYVPGKRAGMVKVKRIRTLDAVVAGWRPGKEEGTVGSLILGLYDDAGDLRIVGHTSGFRAKEKRELVDVLAPYATGERGSADPSRWSADRDLEWVALRPEIVVEVTYDHSSGGRIRHGTKLLRFRDDRDPRSCRYDQLD